MPTKKKPTQKLRKKPSAKIKVAFFKAIETKGKVPMGKILKDAGYGKGSTRNPYQVTNSQSWLALCEEYLPDKTLAKVHSELLYDDSYKARSSGLDMAYKIKGKYAPEKHVTVTAVLSGEERTKLLSIL